jgi:hypothetical protein
MDLAMETLIFLKKKNKIGAYVGIHVPAAVALALILFCMMPNPNS